jgi:hypothetical protein
MDFTRRQAHDDPTRTRAAGLQLGLHAALSRMLALLGLFICVFNYSSFF